MKILRLVIDNFGRIQNKIIDFSEDTNIIMGTDLDTIHAIRVFMDGMLFNLSNEDKKKYRSQRQSYGGLLIFENDNGDQFQVKRNFQSDSYEVTDMNGTDVTEDFVNEYGDLIILPETDTVFARTTIEAPKVSNKDQKKLADLKEKKDKLDEQYDYDQMLFEREKLLVELEAQSELEKRIKANKEKIKRYEARINQLNDIQTEKEDKVNQEIVHLKSQLQEVDLKLKQLNGESFVSEDSSKLLLRESQDISKQLAEVNEKLDELEQEEKVYQEKLDQLRSAFKINKNELNEDYQRFQKGLNINRDKEPEPLIARLEGYSTWVYAILIILGAAGVAYALANPDDTLTRVFIYLLSFFSVFVILMSATILYLQFKKPVIATNTNSSPIAGIEIAEILHKYKRSSKEDFVNFYDDANRLFKRIENLEADLVDIQDEINETQAEKDALLNNRAEYQNQKASLSEEEKKELQEQIDDLTIKRNDLEKQITLLIQERDSDQNKSAWKLKEEALLLEETNKELQKQSHLDPKVIEQFNKLQKKIDHYESKVNNLNNQINKLEDSIEDSIHSYINDYATPGDVKFNEKLAEQFGLGLQNNLKNNILVPYITLNPFENSGEINDSLINKFKQFIEDNQTLIFTTELDELDLLNSHDIEYNGIFVQ